MTLFFAGMSDFTVATSLIGIPTLTGEDQQDIVFTLQPDKLFEESLETFRIEATAIMLSRPLEINEFIRKTSIVTIIDGTSKQ